MYINIRAYCYIILESMEASKEGMGASKERKKEEMKEYNQVIKEKRGKEVIKKEGRSTSKR